MPANILVQVEKSPIPIVWLDTSIISNMAIWKKDKSKLDPVTTRRIGTLYSLIYDHVRNNKIICPLAEQESEIWIERKAWLEIMNDLSLGIRTKTQKGIEDVQFHQFFSAFFKEENNINISYLDAFGRNPCEQLSQINNSNLFVAINLGLVLGEDYQKKLKKDLFDAHSLLHQNLVKSNVKFAEQIELEYGAHLSALFELSSRFTKGIVDENAFWGFINLFEEVKYVKKVTGSSKPIQLLKEYYGSSVYKEMPYAKISSNILAHIITDKQGIKSGDDKDVKHISTMFPYVSIFFTDKRMKHLINKRFKFDELYNTIVCYVGDEKEVEKFFNNLA